MTTKVTVGKSANRSSVAAGEEAARQALGQLDDGSANLAVVFATTGYDQKELLGGINRVTGGIPLVGCSAQGVITAEGCDEGSHAVSVMLLASDTMRFSTFSCTGLAEDSGRCGDNLAELAQQYLDDDARCLLLFPDGLTSNSTRLLQALESKLPASLPIAGGCAGDMMPVKQTYQYDGDQVLTDGVSAVLISGDVTVEIAVSHGCDGIGIERVVTQADGHKVEKIDGLPAWDVFREYLEGDPQTLRDGDDMGNLAIAERLPETTEYGDCIVRVPMLHDMATGALSFGAEMPVGTKVTMTRREPHRVVENAVASARRIRERHLDATPAAVFQLDCAGRGQQLFGEQATQMGLRPLQEELGVMTPWLGCYTFGEIAALKDKTYFHSYTVVMCALYEN